MIFNSKLQYSLKQYIIQLETESHYHPLELLLFYTAIPFWSSTEDDFDLNLLPGVKIDDCYYFVDFKRSSFINKKKYTIEPLFLNLRKILGDDLDILFNAYHDKTHLRTKIQTVNSNGEHAGGSWSYNKNKQLLYLEFIMKNGLNVQKDDRVISSVIQRYLYLKERGEKWNYYILQFIKRIDMSPIKIPKRHEKFLMPYLI